VVQSEQLMERPHAFTADERAQWEALGYVVRENVFSREENEQLRNVAEEVVVGRRLMPVVHIDRNAMVRDGQAGRSEIHAMHKIHHPSCYLPEFLDRVRDERLTDPLVDILGPDVLGINNLFIWKAPRIGLGFPWHQDKYYFRKRFQTDTTVGTWMAIDDADEGNGCLYVMPGTHRQDISTHDELTGPQQTEFRRARAGRDEKGVPVPVRAGSVVWFHSHLLHKSTDNQSTRFRRSYVSHYLSARARWADSGQVGTGQPIMWVRGRTFPDCVFQVRRDVLSLPEVSGQ